MTISSDIPNADAQLHVEFYENDRKEHKGEIFVRILVPGDKTNVFDQPAREHHKERFPRQWLHFQMKHTGANLIGTPIATWHAERPDELTEGHLSELMILKFQTVEQVATASDAQVSRIGMGGAGLRLRAQNYLAARNASTSGAQLNKAQAEIEELKAMVAKLAAAPKSPRISGRPKGRPRKVKVTANVNNDDAAISAASG